MEEEVEVRREEAERMSNGHRILEQCALRQAAAAAEALAKERAELEEEVEVRREEAERTSLGTSEEGDSDRHTLPEPTGTCAAARSNVSSH